MKPAARLTDMHVCPMVTVLVPHVGGPILAPGAPQVLIGGLPAARVSDMCICVGPPDMIVMGSFTVLIGGMPAARMGDMTLHGGVILGGLPTVLIGDGGGGGGGGFGAAIGAIAGAVVDAAAAAVGAVAGAAAAVADAAAVKSGLGAEVDALVAKSPTLSGKLDKLKKDGWTIEWGPEGDGSSADKTEKKIVIDGSEKDDPVMATQSLAHEAGHGTYETDPYVSPTGLTKEQYVQANVKNDLKDEGEATLTNVEVRDEIKKNGGPDIGVSGKQAEKYEEIAAKYPDPKDRDKAREEIGTAFAKGEEPSGTTGQNYEDYYSKTYADFYDENVAPKGP